MKKTIFFTCQILVFAMAACSDSEPFQQTPKSGEVESLQKVRSLESALEMADSWFEQMDSIDGTRSQVSRRIASVKYMTEPNTRNGQADTLLYLVNYDNEMGLALLGDPTSSEGINPVRLG